MKKIILLLIAGVLFLTSCGSKSVSPDSTKISSSAAEATTAPQTEPEFVEKTFKELSISVPKTWRLNKNEKELYTFFIDGDKSNTFSILVLEDYGTYTDDDFDTLLDTAVEQGGMKEIERKNTEIYYSDAKYILLEGNIEGIPVKEKVFAIDGIYHDYMITELAAKEDFNEAFEYEQDILDSIELDIDD